MGFARTSYPATQCPTTLQLPSVDSLMLQVGKAKSMLSNHLDWYSIFLSFNYRGNPTHLITFTRDKTTKHLLGMIRIQDWVSYREKRMPCKCVVITRAIRISRGVISSKVTLFYIDTRVKSRIRFTDTAQFTPSLQAMTVGLYTRVYTLTSS